MKVSQQDIEDVVLSIFTDLSVPAGGKLHHATMMQQWQGYRFRRQDLAKALSSLIQTGAISTENGGDELMLVLTDRGAQRSQNRHRKGWERWVQGLRIGWLSVQRTQSDKAYRLRHARRRHTGRSTDRVDSVMD